MKEVAIAAECDASTGAARPGEPAALPGWLTAAHMTTSAGCSDPAWSSWPLASTKPSRRGQDELNERRQRYTRLPELRKSHGPQSIYPEN
ncbi:hypothetical protein P4200_30865 [Pseudomonas aeruginosa]|nr:hypothetical protein [Pseudomonas aeruginosa]